MSKKIKNYSDFVNENMVMAEPVVKPARPTTKPKPKSPVPFRRSKPSVSPKPKATIEDVNDKFNQEMSDEDKKLIIDYYEKN